MEDEAQSWFFSTPLATLLLCGAVAVFTLGYLPEARKARECEAKVVEAEVRISQLVKREESAIRRIAELELALPEAVEEAAREVNRVGRLNDFLPVGSGERVVPQPPPTPMRAGTGRASRAR